MSTLQETVSKSMALKQVKKVLRKPRQHWVGNGFHVFPVFEQMAFTHQVDPFLMFDYAPPEYFPPSASQRGVGQHPHRGFETITVAFQGSVAHADSLGNGGIIGPGDVQWMTAARGIVHEEFHSPEFTKKGGTMEMCQIWLNLPAKDKMNPPSYQPILKEQIPQIPITGTSSDSKTCSSDKQGYVRIIAGEFNGTKGPAKTHTEVQLLDVNLTQTGLEFPLVLGEGFNTIIFVRRGNVTVNGKKMGPQQVALLEEKGQIVKVQAQEKDSSILILAGKPIKEPIAARGPFCMNTDDELMQAMMDYHNGKLGK